MTIWWGGLLHDGYESVKEMIWRLHWEKNLTIDEMAVRLGIDHSTLKRKIKKLQIVMKKPGGKPFSKQGKKGRKNHDKYL